MSDESEPFLTFDVLGESPVPVTAHYYLVDEDMCLNFYRVNEDADDDLCATFVPGKWSCVIVRDRP